MNRISPALKIALIYFIISFLWIIFSDQAVLFLFQDSKSLTLAQTLKGWFFVITTAIFLYFIIRHTIEKEETIINDYEKIINTSASPMILFNEDGEILLMNKVWQDLTGYDFEEIDTIKKWTKKAYLEDAEEIEKHIFSLFDVEKSTYDAEYDIHAKNGELITWHFSIAPYKEKDGKKTVIATALDITNLKDKEKMMLQQSKMAAMGEILENIAHQWRQPLSTISTASTGLKLQKEMNLLKDDFLLESLDAINSSAQYLSKTIEDFRGFFKPDQEKNYFTLEYSFDKVSSIIGNKFSKDNIEFITDIEDFKIENYDNALIQVFMNIFNNSRDALNEKNPKKKYIFISMQKSEFSAIIQIKDNAGGIPSSIIKKVFDPYFTTKHQSQGTGIGLYMTQEIVTKHMKGKIRVENSRFKYDNEKYVGALFTITLPMKI